MRLRVFTPKSFITKREIPLTRIQGCNQIQQVQQAQQAHYAKATKARADHTTLERYLKVGKENSHRRVY